jgi:hypothetical protein
MITAPPTSKVKTVIFFLPILFTILPQTILPIVYELAPNSMITAASLIFILNHDLKKEEE